MAEPIGRFWSSPPRVPENQNAYGFIQKLWHFMPAIFNYFFMLRGSVSSPQLYLYTNMLVGRLAAVILWDFITLSFQLT